MAGAYTAKPDADAPVEYPPGWNITWPYPGPYPPGYDSSPSGVGPDGEEGTGDDCIDPCDDYAVSTQEVEIVTATGCGIQCPDIYSGYTPTYTTTRNSALALATLIEAACDAYNTAFIGWCHDPMAYEDALEQAYNDAKTYAEQQAVVFGAYNPPGYKNMWHLVAGVKQPWSDRSCNKLPSDGSGPKRCRCTWTLTESYSSTVGFYCQPDHPWGATIMSGKFTPSGLPYATSISGLPSAQLNYVFCISGSYGGHLCAYCTCGGYDPGIPSSPCWLQFGTSCCLEAAGGLSVTKTWTMLAASPASAAGDCP